ncbi:MAG: phospholipid-binding protein MlaC [Gammaproteobacteria bacterium]
MKPAVLLLAAALGLGLVFSPCGMKQAGAAPAAATADPQAIITELANRLAKEVDEQRPALKKDPRRIYAMVDALLLPRFDLEYAGRLVMGTHYRTATPEQRDRFIRALYRSLLKTYGAAVLDFSPERMKVLPYRPESSPDTATVRTEIRRDDGTRIPVNYILRRTPEGWKAWDVVIEGISYVRNFRKDLGAEIERRGLEAVIQRLEAEGAAADPARRK